MVKKRLINRLGCEAVPDVGNLMVSLSNHEV
jgi:hypothetical protein